MHVPSYPRLPAWLPMMMLMLAGFAGPAQAVEFDEKLKAPMARGGAELKTQAESYSATFARLGSASPLEMVTNKALTAERFDLECRSIALWKTSGHWKTSRRWVWCRTKMVSASTTTRFRNGSRLPKSSPF